MKLNRIDVRRVCNGALAMLAVAAAAAADTDTVALPSVKRPDSVYELDKMVVTASRTAHRASETPVAVGVIDKKAIEASPAKTIEDVLASQTSVQLRRPVAIGEGVPSDIIIRGIPGSLMTPRVLILIDGIPTNPSGTPFLIVNQIPLEAVDRIEVVRGPFSCLYGANAFGGVVNIITRDGAGKAAGNVTAETSYPFNALYRYFGKNQPAGVALDKSGPEAYYNATGTVRVGNEKTGVLVSAGCRTIGNYLLSDTAFVLHGDEPYMRADNHNYTEYRLFGKAKYYATDKSDITLNVRYFTSKLGVGLTKYIYPDSLDLVDKGQMLLIGPQARFTIGNDVKLRVGGYYRFTNGEYFGEDKDSTDQKIVRYPMPWDSNFSLISGVRSYRKFAMNDWELESQCAIKLGDFNIVTAGVDFLANKADFGPTLNADTKKELPTSNPTNEAIVNIGGFIQDEITWDRLNVVPGIRLDHHSTFGSALSPKLGVSYKISDILRCRASAGRAFRAPSLAELKLAMNVSSYVIAPNPDLLPEYLWGFDGGFDITPLRSVVVKVGPFYNLMKDLIGTVVDLKTGQISQRNISTARSEGIEAEVEWHTVPWMVIAPHVTFQKSSQQSDEIIAVLDGNATTASLDYVPNVLAGCLINFERRAGPGKIDAQIGYNFVGKRMFADMASDTLVFTPGGLKYKTPFMTLPNYHTFDISCRYKLMNRWWLSVLVQNFFNVKYRESGGDDAPGRFATLKVGYDF
jgi:outer membrane cobalamin receptor